MPADSPKLSILMTSFNAGKYIKQALESILKQTFKDFELLVADDGSTDETRTVLAKFNDPRMKIFLNERNIGKQATINKFFHLCCGEFTTFHDADDISHPTRFEKQIKILDTKPELGIVGCGYVLVGESLSYIDKILPAESDSEIKRALRHGSQFHFPTTIMRTSLLRNEKVLFRPFFKDNNEDVDLTYRILMKSAGWNVQQHLYLYRILEDSISRKNVLRNSKFYYQLVSELTIQREAFGEDDLDKGEENMVGIARKYEYLNNPRLPTLYANSVAYYLYYGMTKKSMEVVRKSFGKLPHIDFLKLITVTSLKIFTGIITKRKLKFSLERYLVDVNYIHTFE